ncbi:MAG: hypothetical protein F4X62_20970 [Caldilineaceae bacterium SB0662_bin_25]|nr:hypothetical protein [Caldilineaceae bacterium SB0662_bin_25]
MIELKRNQLIFRFPEVHRNAKCRISFQRTLRIPDDNRAYSLPPGLGRFPLNLVDDYTESVPAGWNAHGGVFLPMYQAEAMWLNFSGSYPMAVKVAAGKINAVTGEGWKNELSKRPQDYVVIPDQPWLDGFSVMRGMIRQFVAMPLGEGYTAEEQLTGEAEHGGLQIVVYPIKPSYYRKSLEELSFITYSPKIQQAPPREMGLAPGGLMRQEIYEDDYGLEAWETSVRSRCYVHIVNSVQFFRVTGAHPPSMPPTAQEYTKAGLPWFEYYGGDLKALEGAEKLAGLDSVAVKKLKKGEGVLADNEAVVPKVVKKLGKGKVREGEF